MSINKRLNEQYFETKRKQKEGREKHKLTPKQKLVRFLLIAVLTYVSSVLYRSCQERIEENKRKDLMNQTASFRQDLKSSCLWSHQSFLSHRSN